MSLDNVEFATPYYINHIIDIFQLLSTRQPVDINSEDKCCPPPVFRDLHQCSRAVVNDRPTKYVERH